MKGEEAKLCDVKLMKRCISNIYDTHDTHDNFVYGGGGGVSSTMLKGASA